MRKKNSDEIGEGSNLVVMSSMWDPFELCKLGFYILNYNSITALLSTSNKINYYLDDLCTGLILDPKLDFVTHKMDVRLGVHFCKISRSLYSINSILEEFKYISYGFVGSKFDIHVCLKLVVELI